jgi:hypothetical protein
MVAYGEGTGAVGDLYCTKSNVFRLDRVYIMTVGFGSWWMCAQAELWEADR